MAARMDTLRRMVQSLQGSPRRDNFVTAHQIVSEKKHAFLAPGDSEHQDRADGGEDAGGGDDEPLSLEPLCQPATA